MTRTDKPTCELCEKPVADDQGHIMETESATLLIHKGCAMRLMRGVWDELALRNTIPVSELAQKGGGLLISHPENAPLGFVFFSDEDELTEPDVYASDLIAGKPILHKSLLKKGRQIDTSQLATGDVVEVDGQFYMAGWEMGIQPIELNEEQRKQVEEHR